MVAALVNLKTKQIFMIFCKMALMSEIQKSNMKKNVKSFYYDTTATVCQVT